MNEFTWGAQGRAANRQADIQATVDKIHDRQIVMEDKLDAVVQALGQMIDTNLPTGPVETIGAIFAAQQRLLKLTYGEKEPTP